MSKMILVAMNEYKRNVFKKSFIFALLSVPLMLSLNIGLGILFEAMERNSAPVGYVDPVGILADPVPAPAHGSDEPVSLIPFETEEKAKMALESEEIQAYYVLSEDYFETSQIELVYLEEPGENAMEQFYDFLQINLLSDFPEEIANRASSGSTITIRAPDGSREFPAGGPPIGVVIPLVISFGFVFLLMMNAGYLMNGVVDEKQNRTIEVLITSLPPAQMIGGKVLGIIAIGLTQLITWMLFGVLAVYLGGEVAGIEWFQNPDIEWRSLVGILAIAIPSFIMASGLMFTVGSTVVEAQEGQSLGMLFLMPYMVPLYLAIVVIQSPSGSLSTILSILPFTSLLTYGIRSMLVAVPTWQLAVSVGIQTLCALGALWLAGRAFRMGLLRYGQRLRLRELFKRSNVMSMKASRS
jgi:ABC-2 type transport system permease protein